MEENLDNITGKVSTKNTKNKIKERIRNFTITKKEPVSLIIENKNFFREKKEINLLLFFYIFLIIFPISQQQFIENEITLIARGGAGYVSFFSGNILPSSIKINGQIQESSTPNIPLTEPENTIVLFWSFSLTSCENMFYNVDFLLSVDFSNFDFPRIISTNYMFYGCKSLKSIKFNDNIRTSSLKDMNGMFENCNSLESLDLSNFDTSQVTSMRNMFLNCISLVSLDLSSFRTYFVEDVEKMFYNASSLISLDLSSFDMTNIINFNYLFFYCNSLVYVNMISFEDSSNYININTALFNDELSNVIYCIDETKAERFANIIKKTNTNNDCNNSCFSPSRKIIPARKQCIDDCSNDETYSYEYNNVCYNPNSGSDTDTNDYSETNKVTENSQNTDYTTNSREIISQSTEINGKTEENDMATDKESTMAIEEKTETNNFIDNNEYTEKFQNFSSANFFKESIKVNSENAGKKDEIIKNIKEDLMNGNLNSLLEDLMEGSKQDLIAIDNDLIYQITTSDNQNNNDYNNISTINLGECERKLRDRYHINDSLPLIILKVDYYKPGLLIPVIGYEVYDPINKTQLNLNLCKDKLVKLNIPVSINEDKVYKHDPYSDYYNDECSVYTTDNGTDILINDRQNEYIENNYSLCENNCTFNGYDKKTKKTLCECETKPSIGLISNIIKDEDVLSNDFNTTDETNSNIDAMKCIDTLFSKEGLLKNIGSYILLLSFVFLAISTFVFYKCGYHFIETSINDLIKLKNNKKKKVLNSIKAQKSIKKLKKKKKKLSNPLKKKI